MPSFWSCFFNTCSVSHLPSCRCIKQDNFHCFLKTCRHITEKQICPNGCHKKVPSLWNWHKKNVEDNREKSKTFAYYWKHSFFKITGEKRVGEAYEWERNSSKNTTQKNYKFSECYCLVFYWIPNLFKILDLFLILQQPCYIHIKTCLINRFNYASLHCCST